MHLCDVAERLAFEKGGAEWLAQLAPDLSDDVDLDTDAGETNVIELAAFIERANQVIV